MVGMEPSDYEQMLPDYKKCNIQLTTTQKDRDYIDKAPKDKILADERLSPLKDWLSKSPDEVKYDIHY